MWNRHIFIGMTTASAKYELGHSLRKRPGEVAVAAKSGNKAKLYYGVG
jgi:hypothetical protein